MYRSFSIYFIKIDRKMKNDEIYVKIFRILYSIKSKS